MGNGGIASGFPHLNQWLDPSTVCFISPLSTPLDPQQLAAGVMQTKIPYSWWIPSLCHQHLAHHFWVTNAFHGAHVCYFPLYHDSWFPQVHLAHLKPKQNCKLGSPKVVSSTDGNCMNSKSRLLSPMWLISWECKSGDPLNIVTLAKGPWLLEAWLWRSGHRAFQWPTLLHNRYRLVRIFSCRLFPLRPLPLENDLPFRLPLAGLPGQSPLFLNLSEGDVVHLDTMLWVLYQVLYRPEQYHSKWLHTHQSMTSSSFSSSCVWCKSASVSPSSSATKALWS